MLTWRWGCGQYDVGLVQAIEKLTGVTLEEYPVEEEEVLKGITKVTLIPTTPLLPPKQLWLSWRG